MKLLHSTREVVVPEGLSLEVKARQVRVKGPRGETSQVSDQLSLSFGQQWRSQTLFWEREAAVWGVDVHKWAMSTRKAWMAAWAEQLCSKCKSSDRPHCSNVEQMLTSRYACQSIWRRSSACCGATAAAAGSAAPAAAGQHRQHEHSRCTCIRHSGVACLAAMDKGCHAQLAGIPAAAWWISQMCFRHPASGPFCLHPAGNALSAAQGRTSCSLSRWDKYRARPPVLFPKGPGSSAPHHVSTHAVSTHAGQLTRDFKHTRLDFAIVEEDGVKKLRVDCHLGKRKSLAVMRTVTSHIQNLFTGVSKVRLCCAQRAWHGPMPAQASCVWCWRRACDCDVICGL